MKRYKLWKEKNYSDNGYLYLKFWHHPYVKGVIGADFKLTLWQRIQILFCGGISVSFIGN